MTDRFAQAWRRLFGSASARAASAAPARPAAPPYQSRGNEGPPGHLLHDPAANRPRDLDDPFFDRKVQERMAGVIAEAAKKK